MHGTTETQFFRRADMLDTKVGTEKKDDSVEVAKDGYEAMISGKGGVVSGFHNKSRLRLRVSSPMRLWPRSTLRWRRLVPPRNSSNGGRTRDLRLAPVLGLQRHQLPMFRRKAVIGSRTGTSNQRQRWSFVYGVCATD